MTLLPKDRRGLGEIISVASMTVAVSSVIVAQTLKGQPLNGELVAVLIALCMLVAGRGFQSAAERGASSEFHTREAVEMQRAAEEFKREAAEMRRLAFEMIDRQLPPALLPAPAPLPPPDKETP